jgi:hypothetical protein
LDIVFSANNGQEIFVMPVVPPDIPINQTIKNEVFDSVNKGEFKLIGSKGLITISIDSFFPNKEYPFIKKGALSDGWQYVSFFERWIDLEAPIRIVITSKVGVEVKNLPVAIDSFNYSIDKVGDIQYSLELSEYKFMRL